jgi:endo-1,4-beta-mannosidase
MFVKSINGSFSLNNNKPFRFIGANVYELANVDSDITRKIIDDAVNTGFKVLRFWLFQNKDAAVQIKKLNEICDFVKPHGIKLIVSLSDKWGYLQNYKIDENWYLSGYKNEYLNYVKSVTSECSARDEVMIWELINEPETDSFEAFYNFAKVVSEEIKSVNTNHLLSLGTVGGVGDKFGSYFSVFKKSNFEKLYSLPSLDAISIHDYSYDSSIFERLDVLYRFKGNHNRAKIFARADDAIDVLFDRLDRWYLTRGSIVHIPLTLRGVWSRYNKKDIRFAQKINKPLYIGEIGFKSAPNRNRKGLLELDIEKKFSLGICGYMLWSFQAQGWSNDGHGYGFGIDDGFSEIIKKWNQKLSIEN